METAKTFTVARSTRLFTKSCVAPFRVVVDATFTARAALIIPSGGTSPPGVQAFASVNAAVVTASPVSYVTFIYPSRALVTATAARADAGSTSPLAAAPAQADASTPASSALATVNDLLSSCEFTHLVSVGYETGAVGQSPTATPR